MSEPCRVLERAPVACEAARELLSAWLDGELTVDEARVLDDHLSECAGCAAERARLEAVRAAFRSLPLAAPPAGLGAEVLERIRREGGGAELSGVGETARRRRPGRRALRLALAAAALLLAVAGTIWWTGGADLFSTEGAAAEVAAPLPAGGFEGLAADLGADAGCGPDGDCLHLAPCDSPAECGGGPPCSNPGECDGS